MGLSFTTGSPSLSHMSANMKIRIIPVDTWHLNDSESEPNSRFPGSVLITELAALY